ncbi:MAG: hypothetical protein JWN96_2870 [Mycobacterium sp.]|jgi:hypothetical protein|nr:hypothetical protein [Mycobacterium sp.]
MASTVDAPLVAGDERNSVVVVLLGRGVHRPEVMHTGRGQSTPRRILTLGEILAGSMLMTLTVAAYLATIGVVAFVAIKGILPH